MNSRTLLCQSSRALSSSLRSSAARQSLRSQFHNNTPLAAQVASRQFQGRRFYATEPEAEKDEAEAETKAVQVEDPAKKELEKQLQAKDRDNIELKDRLLRAIANFRNLQDRTNRDMQEAKDFAIQRFARDIVDTADNLDRALTTVPAEKLSISAEERNEHQQDLIALHEGLKMTENILMSTLKKHGVERFDPSVKSEKFNPHEHEATFMTPMAGKENGTVFITQQKGYKLNGRILRAAEVGVVKNR
ncbi:putative GrpE protein like protein, mitochondrial [Sclerotinia borealis F-4128]|uniref:GrpE protein homolog n=1 Tax=Sclerotinia borealis (strain F-4128) TaxID=1432307 RepID=W9CJ09_SCLBF|nr:putative GrpE protein like protein, mitochondrial [Sclerotinia borealis F-4128]